MLVLAGCDSSSNVSVNDFVESGSIRVKPAKLSSSDASSPAHRSIPVSTPPMQVTEAQFKKQVAGDQLVLVKFGATWCPPCRLVDTELDRVAANRHSRVTILKIDIDDEPGLASRYGVGSIPRILLLHGGKKIGDWTGYQSAEQLEQALHAARTTAAPTGDVHANPFAT